MDITTQRKAEDPGSGSATGSDSDSGTDSGPATTDARASGQYPVDEERLHRGGDHRMLAGVAAGLADYFDIDPTLVRIGFVALTFLGGLAVPLYLAGWLLIPEEGSDTSVAEDLLSRERAR